MDQPYQIFDPNINNKKSLLTDDNDDGDSGDDYDDNIDKSSESNDSQQINQNEKRGFDKLNENDNLIDGIYGNHEKDIDSSANI